MMLEQRCFACGRPIGSFDDVLEIDGVRVVRSLQVASFNGVKLPLTPKEFGILELLILRAGKVVPHDSFFTLGVLNIETGTNILAVFVCKIRKKLRAAGCDRIKTVWGSGLMWDIAKETTDA